MSYKLKTKFRELLNRFTSKYPFIDGDMYFTYEDGEWIESCWDSVSEEMHDEDPNQIYYKVIQVGKHKHKN